MFPYTPEVEDAMQRFYKSLNEKDRRQYAGIEALKLGHGGKNYIAGVVNCSRRTVHKGAIEVSGLPSRTIHDQDRQTCRYEDTESGGRTQTLLV